MSWEQIDNYLKEAADCGSLRSKDVEIGFASVAGHSGKSAEAALQATGYFNGL